MPTTTETDELDSFVELGIPNWLAASHVEARRLWNNDIIPACLRARQARNRRHRSVELRRAARTVYEAAWEMGGIGELWDASLLLDRCADMAGDALPLDVDQIVCGGLA